MRKNLTILIMILVTYFLQMTLQAVMPAQYAIPDLLLILTCSMGLMRGRRAGMITGFLCGILYDLFLGPVFGLTALCFVYAGYFNGSLFKVFFDDDIRIPIAAIGISEFVYRMILLIAAVLTHRQVSFGVYMTGTVLPSVICSVICSIPLYYLYRAINRSIAVYEEEAEQSPWLRR